MTGKGYVWNKYSLRIRMISKANRRIGARPRRQDTPETPVNEWAKGTIEQQMNIDREIEIYKEEEREESV
jgi:hypothetical protein